MFVLSFLDRVNVGFAKRGLLAVLTDPRVLYCSLVFFISQIGLYGVLFYLPAQVSQIMGRGIGFAVGTMSAVPWMCAFIACATIPRWSDRSGERRLIATACIAPGAGLYDIGAVTALNIVLIYCFPLLGLDAGSGRRPAALPPGDAVLLRSVQL